MNKLLLYFLPGACRVILAAIAIVLAVGPGLYAAVLPGSDCAMPCCGSQAAPGPHGHDKAAGDTAAGGCCSPFAVDPCGLSRLPMQMPPAAVSASSLAIPGSQTPSEIGLPLLVDARGAVKCFDFKAAVPPSSFPPLFLSKNALLR